MYTKRMTYVDFDGVERTEDFRFHLTQAELYKIDSKAYGRLDQMLETIANTKDIPAIMEIFEKIITAAYGEKTADGKQFNKSKEITEAFTHTQAYSDLYCEFINDPNAALEFIKRILPDNVQKEIAELEAQGKVPQLQAMGT